MREGESWTTICDDAYGCALGGRPLVLRRECDIVHEVA